MLIHIENLAAHKRKTAKLNECVSLARGTPSYRKMKAENATLLTQPRPILRPTHIARRSPFSQQRSVSYRKPCCRGEMGYKKMSCFFFKVSTDRSPSQRRYLKCRPWNNPFSFLHIKRPVLHLINRVVCRSCCNFSCLSSSMRSGYGREMPARRA